MADGIPAGATLRVASSSIHSKTFDDEVVVIDMASGLYFSLRGSAVAIWGMVEAGAAPADITTALTARFDGDPRTIADAATRCLDDLVAQGLAVIDPAAPRIAPATGGDRRMPFAPPQIERFTDMQDLLLLDPVHEVSEAGWPHQAAPDQQPRGA